MTITESTRHQLHQALIESLGEEEAATLMEHLPPVGWADVTTKTDLEHLRVATKTDLEHLRVATKTDLEQHRFATKTDLEQLRFATSVDIDSLRAETSANFAQLRSDMSADIDSLRAEASANFAELRSDMGVRFAQADASLESKLNSHLRWTVGTIFASYALLATVIGLWR